ncbi:hypothetical protein MNBD_GAMMA10-2626 [hydrothermal vent metagenome]|uniref:Solute-binding protein family 3/N-terminal domain-containing protein n=1 Tax=hydrothermal vent metagenome TaxID=652676 RepID=A0A3B0XA33_9ZZZZ
MKIFKIRTIFVFLLMFVPQIVLGAYVFTAPPRETSKTGHRVYESIARFLTRSTGYLFEYRQQDTWKGYVKGMRDEQYDLVFDGPHFVDWRIKNIGHRALVKIPHLLQWRVITRRDNATVSKLQDLQGRKVCAPGSPNFGMLNLFNHFKDPDKQPIHVKVKGWNNVYDSVKNGDCVAGVLPKKNHMMYDNVGAYTRAIHTHLPYPNQAFTVSKRISQGLGDEIRRALLSEDGQKALENLRQRYTGGAKLVAAVDEEYDSIYMLLIKAKDFSNNGGSEKVIAHKAIIPTNTVSLDEKMPQVF